MAVSPGEHRALMSELEHLISEERNPNTMEIDLLPTAEVLRAINREDRSVPDAVGKVITEIARAVDRIVDAFGKGGRLNPTLAAWLPNSTFFAIGLVLLYMRSSNRELPKLAFWK